MQTDTGGKKSLFRKDDLQRSVFKRGSKLFEFLRFRELSLKREHLFSNAQVWSESLLFDTEVYTFTISLHSAKVQFSSGIYGTYTARGTCWCVQDPRVKTYIFPS